MTAGPSNQEIADLFDRMAALLEAKGDVIFKIRAYRRAAAVIAQHPQPLAPMARRGEDLKKIPGVGDAISRKIHEFVTTGRVAAYERLKGEVSPIPSDETVESNAKVPQ